MSDKNENIKKIYVSIGGISYQLVSQENEDYIKEIAKKADESIKLIMHQNASLSTMQANILVLVNTFDMLNKINIELDDAARAVESANRKAVKAQSELFSLRDTDFELKKELLRVNELNKQLELEISSLRNQQVEVSLLNQQVESSMDDFEEILVSVDGYCESGFANNIFDVSECQQDIEEMVKEFLGEVQNPFAEQSPNDTHTESQDDYFAGYKQPSIEDLLS